MCTYLFKLYFLFEEKYRVLNLCLCSESLEALERGEMKYNGLSGDADGEDDPDVDADTELDADVELDPDIKEEVDEEEAIIEQVPLLVTDSQWGQEVLER